MQSLDVISVNLWQILISLANLVLLFFILKKFLYKPVKKVLEQRRDEINSQYMAAEQAEKEAREKRTHWETTLLTANEKADEIIHTATKTAKQREEAILQEAQTRANDLVRQAEQDVALERKKAVDSIRQEIVAVSEALSEKILAREIDKNDHRILIDSFIENLGESDE